MHAVFRLFAQQVSDVMGSPWAFVVALLVILMWAVTGPLFGFSDTWQLVINTGTTIVTFLMVFLIQNTQNRDAKAVHLKLDELIHGVDGARSRLIDLENMSDEELDALQHEFQRIKDRAARGVPPHELHQDLIEAEQQVKQAAAG
jgi:low affinity Fe/Cu permease